MLYLTISIKKVANKAQVSTATVSHVINDTRFVAPNTRERVLQAMKELDYIPNHSAKSLRSQKTNIVGVIVPDISNYFFTAVIKGIETVLKKEGFQLIVSNSDENIYEEINQLKMFNSQMVRGLIIASSARKYSDIQPYIKNTPTIFIDRFLKDNSQDFVSVDNKEGTREAINYLIGKGHKRIGMITGIPNISSTIERLEGYKAALWNNNLMVDETLIQSGDSKFQSGFDLTNILIEKNITALFVANNLMTIGALNLLKRKSIKIPEEIAIIGFDDYEWAEITDPPLSVVKQPSKSIGEKSAEVLIQKIKSNTKKVINYNFPAEFIIRSSC